MSVLLTWTRIADLQLRQQLFSGNQEGSLGGPTLAIPRLGDRWAADLATAPLRQDAESRLLIAALVEGVTADVRIPLHQPNGGVSMVGAAAVVNGAAQSGTALAVRGAQPGAAIVRGRMLSIVHAGVHYVHMATAQSIVGADGHATLQLWPRLRFLTVDGEAVEVDRPMIEGQLVGFDKGFGFQRNRTKALEFSIVERA